MAKKRTQITVKQFHLNNLKDEDGKLNIVEEGRDIEHFHNFFIKSIENVLETKIPNDTYFILKFDEIKEDDEDKLSTYVRTLEEGIWLNNQRYVKSVKSPSMVRSQKTLYIREDIAGKVMEYVSLGKTPTHTIVSKLESAYGISLSSVLMVDSLPKIAIIKDMTKIIREDVEVVRDCNVDQEQFKLVDQQIEQDKAIKKEWKENKLSDEKLKELPLFDWTSFETHKSKNQWYKKGRRLKLEDISKPAGHGIYENHVYPVYPIEQTEEIEFPRCTSKTIGKEIKYLENHEVPLTCFDGQALGSFEWFEKVSEELQLKYITNGLQGRLPYFKSLIIRFDFKKWCKDKEIAEIEDIFGNTHKVSELDIIATESCWKAYQDYSTGKKQCLFSSINEWYEAMDKYQIKKFGVANYAKSEYLEKEFTPLNYQFIYALPKLSYEDLRELSKPYEKLLYKVKEGKDVAYIKAFLKMLDSEEGNFSDKCLEMIDIDERLFSDNKIQEFLRNRVKDELRNLMKGRIPIRGGYRYLTQDPIAFMEWAVTQDVEKVKGFLDTPYEVYKRGTKGEHLLMRNPTTSPKESVRANFVKKYNKYMKHLDSIIITGINDLLLPKFTADVDGDQCLFTAEKSLLKAIHDNVPLIHEGDKQFSNDGKVDYSEYNLKEVIEYEKRNTTSMIGQLTNWNTKFQNLALSNEDYLKADLVVSCNKIYQMMLIDAAKTGEAVNIAYPIEMWGKKMKKPYFMYHVYGGDRDTYDNNTNSPLNKYVRWIESQKEKINNLFLKDIDPDYYYSLMNPKDLFQRREGLPHPGYINEVMKKLSAIYDGYTSERTKINNLKRDFESQIKMDQNPEERKLIQRKYTEVKEKYKTLAMEIEPNLSILATAAVELGYRLKQNYNFAWDIAYEGMKSNALYHKLDIKTKLHDLGRIRTTEDITGVAKVGDGKMIISQVELSRREVKVLDNPIVINTDLEDGRYSVLSMMGSHYAILEDENAHDEYLCHMWYEKREEELEKVTCAKVRMLARGKAAIEITDNLVGKEFVLKTVPDKGYANIYKDEEMVCSIAPENVEKTGIKMGMDGWKVFFNGVTKPTKKGIKSFSAIITIG